MSEAANRIETARRAYVAAMGTPDEKNKRALLELEVANAKAATDYQQGVNAIAEAK